MKIIKFLALLLAIGVGAYIIFWLFGVIVSLLWYAVIIGIIALAGTVGYKLLLGSGDEETPKLQEKKPTAISELENADRTLEEYKRKYLK
ncbi:MAG: hypothetical protein ACR2J3_00740 [Aridibacter sp.]